MPNNYTATLSAEGTLEGTFVDSHSEEGKFKLTNTYHVPPPKDNFRTKTVWYLMTQTFSAVLHPAIISSLVR